MHVSLTAHILRRPLTVHLLSTTASSQLFTSIADDLAVRDDLDVEDIDQELVQRMIDGEWHRSLLRVKSKRG
jgi:hypothetical protein